MKQAKVMTEINSDDTRTDKKKTRIKRRSLLRAGAVAAPLAITLYGGISLAHANSTDCVEALERTKEIPHFDDKGKQDGERDFNPRFGVTGRTVDNMPETHWDYLMKQKEGSGASCLQSIGDPSNYNEFHSDSEGSSEHDR